MRHRRWAIVNRALGLNRKAYIPIAKKTSKPPIRRIRGFLFSLVAPFLPSALF